MHGCLVQPKGAKLKPPFKSERNAKFSLLLSQYSNEKRNFETPSKLLIP